MRRLLLLIAALTATLPVAAQPALTFEPATLDLGDQLQQQALERTVTVKNTGATALKINSVQADCGCTVPEMSRHEIPPGESAVLRVHFETRALFGTLHRNVRLVTNQGTATLPLVVRVTPYADWEIAPLPLVLPPSLPAMEASGEVRLRYTGTGRVQPIAAQPNHGWLKADLLPEADGRTFRLLLTKLPGAPVGNNSAVVAVHTDSTAQPLLSLQAIIPVSSELRLSPNPVILPRVTVGTDATVTFKLSGWKGEGTPRIEVAQGILQALDAENGTFTYQLTVPVKNVGTQSFPLHVYRGGRIELDAPVITRGTKPDEVR